MPSLKSIRTRIASVKSTQKITRAMKLVSAARLRRAQDAILGARPYANALAEAIVEVALRAGADAHPLLERRDPERLTMVPLTSDRGLAGGFNANVFRAFQRFTDEQKRATPPARQIALEIVGKKGRDYFRRRRMNIRGEYVDMFRDLTFDNSVHIADKVIDLFSKAEIDAVYLFVNEFKNVMSPNVTMTRVLPIELPPASGHVDYIFEQPVDELLEGLLKWYVRAWLFRALVESAAAEHAARMTAMEAASKNAGEMITNLTRYMNRVRQASITRELIEIVSGAAALE